MKKQAAVLLACVASLWSVPAVTHAQAGPSTAELTVLPAATGSSTTTAPPATPPPATTTAPPEATPLPATPPIQPPGGWCVSFCRSNSDGLVVAIGQAAGFTGFQHLVRLREQKTRRELAGPFVEEWMTSASHLGSNWDDGGKIFTNYVAHPMGGAVYAHIYRQNDRQGRYLQFGQPGYGAMVLRALAFSAAASAQFEIGPLSEASIGNVGMRDPRKMAWVDLVVTPALGTAWMVGEDLLDSRVLASMDGRNAYLRNTVRFWANPSRSGSNMARGRWPWYRERDSELYRRQNARK